MVLPVQHSMSGFSRSLALCLALAPTVAADEALTTTAIAVGWIASVVSFALFLSPAPTVYTIWKKRDTLEFSPLPMISMFANCLLWMVYAILQTNRIQPLVTNVAGALISGFYTAMFTAYLRRDWKSVARFNSIVVATCSVIVTALITIAFGIGKPKTLFEYGSADNLDRAFVVGIFAAFFNVILLGSNLSVAFNVIKTKSVRSMPLPVSVACVVVSSLWGVYAALVQDLFIALPNVIGCVLACTQVILYFHVRICYRKRNLAQAQEGTDDAAVVVLEEVDGAPLSRSSSSQTDLVKMNMNVEASMDVEEGASSERAVVGQVVGVPLSHMAVPVLTI